MVPGMQDLSYAAKEKVTSDHDVIDDAIRENADVWCTSLFAFDLRICFVLRCDHANAE